MRYIVILLSVWAGAAFAAEVPRKIDFTIPITDQDNEIITECSDNPPPKDDRDCKVRRPITLGIIAMRALSAPEQGLPADKALVRGQLALSVYKSSGSELTADEIKLIKDQIAAKFPSPLIVIRAFAILDPASVK